MTICMILLGETIRGGNNMRAYPEGNGLFVTIVLTLGVIAWCLMMRYM